MTEEVEAVEIPGGFSDFGDLGVSIDSRDLGDPVVSQNHSGPLMRTLLRGRRERSPETPVCPGCF
ncbi:MAG: hypothetical protein ACOX4K_09145 [Bacillota bacterium]|jgi:hypothetical protein